MNPGRVYRPWVAWSLSLIFLAAAPVDEPRETRGERSGILPDGRTLIDQVLRALPEIPVQMDARLMFRSPETGKRKTLRLKIGLQPVDTGQQITYTILDQFGTEQEELTVKRNRVGGEAWSYRHGEPLQAGDLPHLFIPITGTEVNWIDLSFSYLFWENGKTIGVEELKGRRCYVVDINAPNKPGRAYSGIRLWIEPRVSALLQAEMYSLDGRLVKRLEVKSYKKIGGIWMIKDLDIRQFPEKTRSRLRIDHLEAETIDSGLTEPSR